MCECLPLLLSQPQSPPSYRLSISIRINNQFCLPPLSLPHSLLGIRYLFFSLSLLILIAFASIFQSHRVKKTDEKKIHSNKCPGTDTPCTQLTIPTTYLHTFPIGMSAIMQSGDACTQLLRMFVRFTPYPPIQCQHAQPNQWKYRRHNASHIPRRQHLVEFTFGRCGPIVPEHRYDADYRTRYPSDDNHGHSNTSRYPSTVMQRIHNGNIPIDGDGNQIPYRHTACDNVEEEFHDANEMRFAQRHIQIEC